MENELDKMEVRTIFRRNTMGRVEMGSTEDKLVECIADAVAEVISENNSRVLEGAKSMDNNNQGVKS